MMIEDLPFSNAELNFIKSEAFLSSITSKKATKDRRKLRLLPNLRIQLWKGGRYDHVKYWHSQEYALLFSKTHFDLHFASAKKKYLWQNCWRSQSIRMPYLKIAKSKLPKRRTNKNLMLEYVTNATTDIARNSFFKNVLAG